MIRAWGAVVSLALVASTEPVWAQEGAFPPCEKQATEDDVDAARGAHTAAKKAFSEEDYDRALRLWKDAYAFDCSRPPLLVNIASAYEMTGQYGAAVRSLETFLERAPDAPNRAAVEEKLTELRKLAEEEAATPAPAPVPEPLPTPPPEPAPAVSPSETERPFGVAPWIVVGIGAAATIGGVIPFVIGQSKIASAEETCPDHGNCNDAAARDEGNSGNSLRLVGSIVAPAGLLVAAAGLTWQFAFNDPQPADQIAVAPWLGPDAGGATIQGAF